MPEKNLINSNGEDSVVETNAEGVVDVAFENDVTVGAMTDTDVSEIHDDVEVVDEIEESDNVDSAADADAVDAVDAVDVDDAEEETKATNVEGVMESEAAKKTDVAEETFKDTSESVDTEDQTKEDDGDENQIEENVNEQEDSRNESAEVVPSVELENLAVAKQKKNAFKRQQKAKRVVSGIFLTILWAIGLCSLYLCFSNLYQQMFNPGGQTGFFGIGEAIVASNSMEPKLCPNDLIFYKETDIYDIEIGDTIVYQKTDANGNNILIVHDVVQIGDGYVTTQGINNAAPDEAFPISAIVGKYMFKIGKIGVILNLLSTKWAPAIIIGTLFVIFAIRIVAYYVRKKRIIAEISTNANTRKALSHFFDV